MKSNITSEEVRNYVKENDLNHSNCNNNALYLMFLGMKVETINGRHLCPSIFQEDDFLRPFEFEITYDDAETSVKALKSISSSGLVDNFIKRRIENVINSLESAMTDRTSIVIVSE
ncbi:MAG: hypothetical protein [Caudoviricetes sp.]|nr:MAG: hypothetical protein [Caudoviricetes sp.]